MDPHTNPYTQTSNFVDLLTSQQPSVLPEPFRYESLIQCTATSSIGEDIPTKRKERKKWSPTNDIVLISSWLNTSKDLIVGNEQKAVAFWKRIANYFAASPKLEGGEKHEPIQCKKRWQKLNDLVCKFCGCYEAATKQKTSGMNENDVVKLAHEIFYTDHKKRFTLQPAWEELINDQKLCEKATNKMHGSAKKRRCEDGAHSESSQATTSLGDQPTNRHPGVKAAKCASGKRSVVDGKALSEFQTMWSIKEKDLAVKERLSKMGLLDKLIAKTEPLSEEEEALKKKLITEMLAN